MTKNNKLINDMDYYKFINENGLNGSTAMNLGCRIALSWLEDSEEVASELHNSIVESVNDYCKIHKISDKSRLDFLSEVNEYSLK